MKSRLKSSKNLGAGKEDLIEIHLRLTAKGPEEVAYSLVAIGANQEQPGESIHSSAFRAIELALGDGRKTNPDGTLFISPAKILAGLPFARQDLAHRGSGPKRQEALDFLKTWEKEAKAELAAKVPPKAPAKAKAAKAAIEAPTTSKQEVPAS